MYKYFNNKQVTINRTHEKIKENIKKIYNKYYIYQNVLSEECAKFLNIIKIAFNANNNLNIKL